MLTPLASSETRCLTSCEHFSSRALVPPARRRSVCVLLVGIPRQSRPWHEMNQPIRRWKTALHPLFLLGLLRRTLQRKQLSMYIPNLRRPIRLAHWPTLRPVLASLAAELAPSTLWATSCHRAVSQLSQLFSCVIVGPSAGNHSVDAVTTVTNEPRQSLRDVPPSP